MSAVAVLGPGGQLAALTRLRWRMLRSRSARGRFVLAAFAAVICLLVVVAGASDAPDDLTTDTLFLLPTLLLGFLVLSTMAAIAAGGGTEMVPAEQLVAFPLNPRTQFLAGLLLAPVNIAWVMQVVTLVAAVSYVILPGVGLATSLLGLTAYIVMATVAAQTLGWLIIGIRQRRSGRIITWTLAALAVLGIAWLLRADRLIALLDRSPGTALTVGILRPIDRTWWTTVGLLVATTVVVGFLGIRVCMWALHRSNDTAALREGRPIRHRRPARGPGRELLAVDRASVWRSVPLRRGALVLGVLPGAAAALAGLEWTSIPLLPGLVAAGAGLLFGVNAFSLDGGGAVWTATLPHDPTVVLWAKARVIAEVTLITVGIAVTGAALRTDGRPSPAAAAAVLAAIVVAVAGVVTRCLRWSVTRPHRAELRGPRDTPAPPGTMAMYSTRLALRMTLIGGLFVVAAQSGSASLPLLLTIPFLIFAALSLVRTLSLWRDPETRARVVTGVAHG